MSTLTRQRGEKDPDLSDAVPAVKTTLMAQAEVAKAPKVKKTKKTTTTTKK